MISYGFSEKADIRATDVQTNGATTSFTVTMNGQELPVTIPMIGLFNVYNVLAAFAVAVVNGISLERAVSRMKTFPWCGWSYAVDSTRTTIPSDYRLCTYT